MKSTGMIRKIDELGRIVIPKEIRKILRLKSEQYLEMFLEDEKIILKKYFPVKGVSAELEIYFSVFYDQIRLPLFITDNEKLIFNDNQYKDLVNEVITKEILNVIEKRKVYESEQYETKSLFENKEFKGYFYISPIIINGDCDGAIIMIAEDQSLLSEKKELVELLNHLIAKTLED
jgi:AbrB family transcriptional regulator, stage V sporulation protein T